MKKAKIKFEIEQKAYQQIYQALTEYGDYEIGGMLIGYMKGNNQFSISNATVADDINRFNIASFIREPFKSMKKLLRLFRKENHNYIGEWHSHPRFSLSPSSADVQTMKGIISDPGYGVNFALLIITKLRNSRADMAGFLFHKQLPNFVQASISQKQNIKEGVVDISV